MSDVSDFLENLPDDATEEQIETILRVNRTPVWSFSVVSDTDGNNRLRVTQTFIGEDDNKHQLQGQFIIREQGDFLEDIGVVLNRIEVAKMNKLYLENSIEQE